MKVFVVYAHHDRNSFARGMLDRALEVLAEEGHEVRVSDLHAMNFKAVADDDDFTTPRPDGPSSVTSYQARQKDAVELGTFTQDILDEQDKLDWADAVLFIFPYYFFNMPAILKGWCERVIVYWKYYAFDHPTIGAYAQAGLSGKRALIGMTSGAPAPEEGLTVSRHHERIEAMQNGSLNYAGFDVLTPFIAWGVPWVGQEALDARMDEWADRLHNLFDEEPEIPVAKGPTPAPELLTGRARSPGDWVWPYGNDRAIAEKVVMAKLKAQSGKSDALVDKLRPYVEAAVNDIGAPIYSVLRSPHNSDEVWLIEAYEDADAHKRHQQSPSFDGIAADLGGLLAAPPEVITLRPEFSKGI
ncbi:hypothetical protein HFP57_07325 [Parasphingopyxis algicola]|uniref:NAD(P)H-dependent oxidoreductase n=1 Tax=Parasphingopyxis algicola TaxID=2026624 RepID=UPI0015A4C5D6|nr:NAD(P)H-dependent oxidoreductase [Parasphingopyxis algicola]QLC24855.1 hypothetical protein HFP57_07325 [Parasphingopyxis algicola]